MQKYKTLEEFLNDLNEDKRQQVDTLRDLIINTAPQLEEHIKWSAPSYVLNGEDRITFNLMNKEGAVKLVIHMGATRKEDKKGKPILENDGGIVEWSSDIRGVITFQNIEDIQAKNRVLKKLLSNWLAIS